MTKDQDYVEACKVSEISDGHIIHVDIKGKEIAIANLDGKCYAFADRCGHMNARLSGGSIKHNVVTCPFHEAKFDITSGKMMAEPTIGIPPGVEPLPPKWQKYMEFVGQQMSFIKTYNQEIYEVKLEGDVIKIKV